MQIPGEAVDARVETIEGQLEVVQFIEAGLGFALADQAARFLGQVVGQGLAQAVEALAGPVHAAAQVAGEQLATDRAEPARQFVFPVQLQVLEDAGQFQQHGAVAAQADFRAVQDGGLVLGQGQLEQAAGGCAEHAVGAFPVAGQLQALGAGEDEQLERGALAVDLDQLAFQPGQARQRGAVHLQHAVEAKLNARQQRLGQHQGLMPRCRATMPPVMLW